MQPLGLEVLDHLAGPAAAGVPLEVVVVGPLDQPDVARPAGGAGELSGLLPQPLDGAVEVEGVLRAACEPEEVAPAARWPRCARPAELGR